MGTTVLACHGIAVLPLVGFMHITKIAYIHVHRGLLWFLLCLGVCDLNHKHTHTL